jgi:hypothetical protein
MSRKVLHDDPWLHVEHDPVLHLVIMRRTAEPLSEAVADQNPLAKVRLALLAIDRASTGVLVDMRAPQIRSDALMDRVNREFQELIRGFRRTAVLVRTATGLLQVGRTAREGATGSKGFTEEAEALAWLRT